MSQNLQNFVKFQKFQLENLVDFEKCCKTHILLQKSASIQPKTSNILRKLYQPTLSDGLGAVREQPRPGSRLSPRELGGDDDGPANAAGQETKVDLGGWTQRAVCGGSARVA